MAKKNLYPIVENGIYHVFNIGNNKKRIFLNNVDYLVFVRILQRYYVKSKNDLIAYCLMPNHYHLMLRVNDKPSHITEMKVIQSRYARKFNIKYKQRFHLFGEKYNRVKIKSDVQALVTFRYILRNPIEAGIVNSGLELLLYRWSSITNLIDESRDRFVNPYPIIRLFDYDYNRIFSYILSGKKNWHLQAGVKSKEIKLLYKMLMKQINNAINKE